MLRPAAGNGGAGGPLALKCVARMNDLKKIPGVPFKKIEEKKDRLVFGIVPKKPE